MLQLSERDQTTPEQPEPESVSRRGVGGALQATSTRRALMLTALGALLIAGIVTAAPIGERGPLGRYVAAEGLRPAANPTFADATPGSCINWPDNSPDTAAVVDCNDDHRFEVAESIDLRTYPGTEYGPDAAPPAPARIQQISAEQCEPAVKRYLAAKYDPNSRFSISLLWAGDKAWQQSGERRMLCGLQLPGPANQQIMFKGRVADLDQSKVWPTGTCLGIEPSTNQPNDAPVDCSAPHAMEVTGTVNLAEKFPDVLPTEADQDAFIKDVCNQLTDTYLAPTQLRDTTLTLIYSTVSLPSWNAGSRQVSCNIGATLGNGGWATLINTAKGPVLINGQPPIPPPSIPEERLNLPLPPAMPGFAPRAASPGTNQQPQSQQPAQQTVQQTAPAMRQEPAPAVPPIPPSDDLGAVAPPAAPEPVVPPASPEPVVPEPVPASA